MTRFRLPGLLAAGTALALVTASASMAQRQAPASPEQRIDRLEKQVGQMQRQVFPRGRPADTAGFADEPAATQSSVASIAQRLDALERQMTEILRLSEENGNAVRSVQSELSEARKATEARLNSFERRMTEIVQAPPTANMAPPSENRPVSQRPKPVLPPAAEAENGDRAVPATDPGEDAYSVGFRQWSAGDHDAAIRSLRSFVAEYPSHRRVSFANNLIGRALLDKGQPRAAADVLLSNYRKNPKGERAADSLYYLGQAQMKLGQPGQACKAYAEIEAIYGSRTRADLAKLVNDAKVEAKC